MDLGPLNELLQEALTAAEENQYETAVILFGRLLAESEGVRDEAGVKALRFEALIRRGRLLRLMGRPVEALADFELYYMEAGSSRDAMLALILLGGQQSRMKRDEEALVALREALSLAEAFNDTDGRARSLQGIGIALANLGRLEDAISFLRKALALFEQLDNSRERMLTWAAIGINQARQGALDKTLAAFQASLELARDIGPQETAVCLSNLGECYQSFYDMHKALQVHLEALDILEQINLPARTIDICRNLGMELCYLERMEEGLEYLYFALDLSREHDQPDLEMQALYSLALNEIGKGDAAKGYDHADRLLEMAERVKGQTYMAFARHALGLAHRKRGNLAAAEQLWQEAIFLAHETKQRALLWQLHAALAEIAGEPPLAAVHYRIAAEFIRQIAYPITDMALKQTFLEAPPVKAVLEKAPENHFSS
jgi:tetratricopeptide (TPR) repeat protein